MARASKSKSPRLSFEATHALNQASEPFFGIERAIERLEESDLMALAAEARRLASDSHRELYAAVAAFADAKLAILVARRSADGIWYACVDVIKWEPNQHTGRGIASYSERCEGRDAAVDTARRLLASHVTEFSEETTVDARILTELEWAAENQSGRNS